MESNPMDIYGTVGQLGNIWTFPHCGLDSLSLSLFFKLFFLNSFKIFSLCMFTVL